MILESARNFEMHIKKANQRQMLHNLSCLEVGLKNQVTLMVK